MKKAYLDSSYSVAIALKEPGFERLRANLHSFDEIAAADILEPELRSALARERCDGGRAEHHLASIRWLRPERRLTLEIDRVLGAGYLRGADLWHLACALYVSPNPREIAFLTLDREQKRVARKLGFRAK